MTNREMTIELLCQAIRKHGGKDDDLLARLCARFCVPFDRDNKEYNDAEYNADESPTNHQQT